jgi:HD superfamily phosphodiesterase
MKLLSSLFHYVTLTSKKYGIDESHGLGHSMEVLRNANQIFSCEVSTNPFLIEQERIIYTASVIHDMCDKKYMVQEKGICEIESFLGDKMLYSEIDAVKKIISTMSYSTVKKQGFPILNEYQHAYHIVREADLLAAYDVERAIIYNLYKTNGDLYVAYKDVRDLFDKRIFKHFDDGLLITEYSKKKAMELERESHKQLEIWGEIVNRL